MRVCEREREGGREGGREGTNADKRIKQHLLAVAVEELYGTRYQSGSYSLINVGSGFHCLHSFFSVTGNMANIKEKAQV